MAKVDIVIVNWNAGRQLQECISSLFAHEDMAIGDVVVVDNASRDGSASFCHKDPRITLLEPGRNLGFGSACNLGAAQGTSDFILFLNPDTKFLRPTLQNVITFMAQSSSSDIGVCGVRLLEEGGETAKHCARLPAGRHFFNLSLGLSKWLPRLCRPIELIEFDHDHDAYVPHVMGAFFFVRRSVFAATGFDERYFVYYEDLDLSLRIQQLGWRIYYLSSESIFHRTGGTSAYAKAKALSYLWESRFIYARSHYGWAGRAAVTAGVLLVEPLRRLGHALIARSPAQMRETIKAMMRLWAILLGRRLDRS